MKKIAIIVAVAALVASGLNVTPAAAQSDATVPAVVNIEDPYGDANTQSGDQQLGEDASTVADLGKVWFSHDATNFNIHILTEGPPGINTVGLQYVVTAGPEGCAVFSGYYNGLTYVSDAFSRLVDGCNGLDPIDGTFTFVEGPDGQGLATMTIPRAGTPLLADGASVSEPFAQSWIFAGGEQLTPSGYRGVRNRIDDTKVGTDYSIAASGPADTPAPTKPEKPKKPAKPKKPKKPKTPPAAPECPAYVPGDNGKDAELVKVTDAATAESPVVVEFDAGQGLAVGPTLGVPLPDTSTRTYHNIQVDSVNPEVGLYVRLEFADRHDYDLYLQYPDGTEADHSGDFNTILESPVHSCGGTSCSSGSNFEEVDGIATADCGGWTTESVAYLTNGGDVTMKVWLGEVKAAPATPE